MQAVVGPVAELSIVNRKIKLYMLKHLLIVAKKKLYFLTISCKKSCVQTRF
jgi:hypothetical protein